MSELTHLRRVAEAENGPQWDYVTALVELRFSSAAEYVATFNPALVSLLLDVVEAAEHYLTETDNQRLIEAVGAFNDAALTDASGEAGEET